MTDIKEKARIVIVREKVKNIRGRPASRLIKAAARYRIIEKSKQQNSSETPVDRAELFAAKTTQTAVGLGAAQIQSMRRRGSVRADNTPQQKMRRAAVMNAKERLRHRQSANAPDSLLAQSAEQDIKSKSSLPKVSATPAPAKPTGTEQRKKYVQYKNLTRLRNGRAKTEEKLIQRLAAALTKSTTRTARSVVLSAAGGVIIIAVCALMLIAGIAASPFGILFANEPQGDGAIQLNAAVAKINAEYAARLDEIQDGKFEEIIVSGDAPDWREVVAVFACKVAGGKNGLDVATMDEKRISLLRSVFWDMVSLDFEIETVETEDDDPDNIGGIIVKNTLKITIGHKTADDMRSAYAFSKAQNKALDELLSDPTLLKGLMSDLTITQTDAVELLKNLPDDLDEERRAVVKAALSLVGKVNYFWGGKSLTLGWDYRWGTTMKVTSEGSQSTGTYRPYGLDCSGFVDWAFYNATAGQYYPSGGDGGTQAQLNNCYVISESEALPGDLVFASNIDHVGIVGGRDDNGNLLIIHCTGGGYNNVVITGMDGFFGITARPQWY